MSSGQQELYQDTAAERDRLRQTVIDGEKRCIELLQERDQLLVGNAELVTALADLLKLLDTTTGLPSYAKARVALERILQRQGAHGPAKESAS